MNHWGQSPLVRYWWAYTIRNRSRIGPGWPVAASSSTGPWQTSRTPHAAPLYCSSPWGVVKWISASWRYQGITSSRRAMSCAPRPDPPPRAAPRPSPGTREPGSGPGSASGSAITSGAGPGSRLQAVARADARDASRRLPVSASVRCVTGFVRTTTWVPPAPAPSSCSRSFPPMVSSASASGETRKNVASGYAARMTDAGSGRSSTRACAASITICPGTSNSLVPSTTSWVTSSDAGPPRSMSILVLHTGASGDVSTRTTTVNRSSW